MESVFWRGVLPFSPDEAMERVDSLARANGFKRKDLGRGSARFIGRRAVNLVVLALLLLVLWFLLPFDLLLGPSSPFFYIFAPVTALWVAILAAYYFTRKRSTLDVTIEDKGSFVVLNATANGRESMKLLGTISQSLSGSLLQGSSQPFNVRERRRVGRIVLGSLAIVAGIAIFVAIAQAASQGVYVLWLLPFALIVMGGYYVWDGRKKAYVEYLPLPRLVTPATTAQAQPPSAQPKVAGAVSPFPRKCLSCGAVVQPDATVCPNCGSPIERVYAVIHRPDLKRGFAKGYAILVTDKRVVGRKWFKWAGAVAYARYMSYYLLPLEKGGSPHLTPEDYMKAYEEAFEVVKDPDFSFDRGSISRVRIRPKGLLKSGHIVIETPSGSVEIKSWLKRKWLVYQWLVTSLRELLGPQAVIEE
ncbi:MAG: zinc-ribbon domain-containing protein [Acidilobus sp.]